MDSGLGEEGSQGVVTEFEPDGYFSENGIVLIPEEVGPGMDSPRVGEDLWCQYPGCVNSLTYGGRGRKPKFCDEHKKSGGSKSVSPSGDKSLDAKMKRIAAGLSENIQIAGTLTTAVLPCTGYIILRDSDRVANETVKLAAKNPKMLAALEKANQIAPGVFLGKFMVTVGFAVAVDTQRIDPDQQAATLLGVTAIYQQLHGAIQDDDRVYVPPAPTIPTL